MRLRKRNADHGVGAKQSDAGCHTCAGCHNIVDKYNNFTGVTDIPIDIEGFIGIFSSLYIVQIFLASAESDTFQSVNKPGIIMPCYKPCKDFCLIEALLIFCAAISWRKVNSSVEGSIFLSRKTCKRCGSSLRRKLKARYQEILHIKHETIVAVPLLGL